MKERQFPQEPLSGPHRAGLLLSVLLAAVSGPAAAEAQIGIDGIDRTLDQTLDPTLRSGIPPIDPRLRRPLAPEVDETVEEAVEPVRDTAETSVGTVVDTVDTTAGEVTGAAPAAVDGVTGRVAESLAPVVRDFVADTDPLGQVIEQNTLIMLYTDGRDRFDVPGLEIRSVRQLDVLGGTLVTYVAASPADLATARERLAAEPPDPAADFNHLYEPAASSASAPVAKSQPGGQPASSAPDAGSAGGPVIGMIDSAVAVDHPAFLDAAIRTADFVAQPGTRPTEHGTAVASRLLAPAAERTQILVASVFLSREGYGPGATAESVVLALEWLARQHPHAINISLAGPPNHVLERVLRQLISGGGPAVIAAVGNEGPAAGPRYPAAYPGVVGVTATDSAGKVYPFANRGGHVDFAALGVDVPVANPLGGWGRDSGTSMAAPRVTALVAALRQAGDLGRGDTASALIPLAVDLGPEGYDPVFGHGLLDDAPPAGDPLRTLSQD